MKLPNLKSLKFSTMFGWRSRLQQRKGTYYIALDKKIIRGLALNRGDSLLAYLGEDERERPLIVVFLDKKDVNEKEDCW
jgi:hypothetical protein